MNQRNNSSDSPNLFRPKRTRGPNFTPVETNHLISLVQKYRAIIDNNKTDATSVNEKYRTWQAITEEYNRTTLSHERSLDNLKALWSNCKAKAKKQGSEVKPSPIIIKHEANQDWEILVDENEESHTDSEDYLDNHSGDWSDKHGRNISSEREDVNTMTRSEKSTGKSSRKEKEELFKIQKELLQTQLINAQEKLEHDRKMRQIELEEKGKEIAHNVLRREYELQILNDRKNGVCNDVLNS